MDAAAIRSYLTRRRLQSAYLAPQTEKSPPAGTEGLSDGDGGEGVRRVQSPMLVTCLHTAAAGANSRTPTMNKQEGEGAGHLTPATGSRWNPSLTIGAQTMVNAPEILVGARAPR